MQWKKILYDWGGLNDSLFYTINKIHSPTLDFVMATGTKLGNYKLFPAYLCIIIVAMYVRSMQLHAVSPEEYIRFRAACIETVLVLCAAYALSSVWIPLIKNHFHFLRPFAALPDGTVFITDAVRKSENPNVSFPSGHTEFAVLMVAGLWPMLRAWAKDIGVLLVIWVALSRISLGVHFPADVIYSALFSLIAVIAVRYAVRRMLSSRRKSRKLTAD